MYMPVKMKRSNTGPKAKPLGSKVKAVPKGSRRLPEPTQDGTKKKDSGTKSLARYISKEMVLKVTRKSAPIEVTNVNLTLTSKHDEKKIQFIENLETFTRIQILCLAYNQIAKIERLDKLTKIRDLDLSCNRIEKIEGLETLVNLQRLDLSDNLIESIPVWLGKRNRALRVVHITGNMLFSLTDVFRLRHLQDLTDFAVAGNPLCDLPHHRLYTIFHLRSLEVLDRVAVVDKERHDAETRFAQEEIVNLGGQLEKEEKKFKELEANHNKSLVEAKTAGEMVADMKKIKANDKKQIKGLEGQLQAKDDLLKRKTAELTKACQKHYRLEQELAFHKIDAKFEPLGYFPDTLEIEEGGTEESAYLGRASYKRNQHAGEHFVLPGGQGRKITRMGGDHVDSRNVNPEIQQQMHGVLDNQLATKQKQIAKAQERLSQLQDHLDKTERKVQDANDELDQVSKATPRAPLSEEEKQDLQQQLVNKVQSINELRRRIAEIEDGMHKTLDIIQSKDEEMNRLKKQLAQMRQGEPGYAETTAAVAEKEDELDGEDRQYTNLQKSLAESLDLLEQEMKKVKKLQRQLDDGEVEMNDELKKELEDVVDGLTGYLRKVQEQQALQQREADALKKERDQLMQRLREAEAEKGQVPVDEIEAVQRRLNETEIALKDLEDENESLRRAQAETSIGDADKDIQLQEAEEELGKLKDALKQQQRQAQADQDAMQKQLAGDRRKLEDATRKARGAGDKEAEARHLAAQLDAVKAENEMLASRFQNQEAEMGDLLNTSLNPDDVARRIQQAAQNIERGAKKRTRPLGSGDVVGVSIADLEGQIGDRLKRTDREKEEAQRQKDEADAEIQALRDQLADLHHNYEQAAAEAKEEADRMAEEEEMEGLRDEMKRLQEQLRQEQRKPQRRRPQEVVQDPHDNEQQRQLEKALRDAERQMRDNDQLATEELAAAEAQMQELRDELARNEERDRARQRREAERHRQAALAEAEALASAQAQQAADELGRAQEEIDGLERALSDKDKALREEMQQSGRVSQAVAEQQEEIGALYDTLEDQKGEILRLHDMLGRLTGNPQGPVDDEMNPDFQDLIREIRELRDAIHNQENSMGNPPGAPPGPERRRPMTQEPPFSIQRTPQANTGHHPTSHGRFFTTSPYPESPGRLYLPPQGYQNSRPIPMPNSSQPGQQHPQPTYSSQPPPEQPHTIHGSQPAPHQPPPNFASQPASQQAPVNYGNQPASQQPSAYGGQPTSQQPPTTYQGQPAPQQPYGGQQLTHQPQVSSSQPQQQTLRSFQQPSSQQQPGGSSVYPSQPSVNPTGNNGTVHNLPHAATEVRVLPGETTTSNRVVQAETPRRGKLKQVRPLHGELFCNVPEHHDMEDELAHLEKLLAKKDKKKRRSSTGAAERLEAALSQRRDELDGLDLAVEHQQKRLKQLRDQDEDLKQEKSQTIRQLDDLKKTADEQAKMVHRRAFLDGMSSVYPEEEDYNDLQIIMREDELDDEIRCLEQTLAKRRAELREADRLLQECNNDLRQAQDKARETITQYDETCTRLQRTREDADQLESRVTDTARHLVEAEEQLANLREHIQGMEEERLEKQNKLTDVERIISARDVEYRTLETRAEQTSARLRKLQTELIVGEQRETAQLTEAREREKLLVGRKAELEKLQDQIEQHHEKLSQLNREIGEKQRELQTMTNDLEKNRRDLVSALREGEGEISDTQQKIREVKSQLEDLQAQKRDLTSSIQDQRSELATVRADIEQEENTFRQLQSSIDKQKAELKHTLEMIQLEKTELEALKLQHDNKMADLERTQLATLEERTNLEKLETASQHLQAEVERTKQLVENQKDEKRRLERERRALEENVKLMENEKDILRENCLALETKLDQINRQYQSSEADIEQRSAKLQHLDQGVNGARKELDDLNAKKNDAKKELQTIKNQLKESKSKLQTLREQVETNEDQKHLLDQEVSDKELEKSQVEDQLKELQSAVQQAHNSLAERTSQERHKQDVLRQLEADIEECHQEIEDKRQALEEAQAEVDREEAKLSRLIGALTVEAEGIKGDVAAKRQELDRVRSQVLVVDKQLEEKQLATQRITHTHGDISQLRKDLKDRNEEKTRLAEALNFSHSELEGLRKEKRLFEKRVNELTKEMEGINDRMKQANRDHDSDREKLLEEIASISEAAEEHSSRADRLGRELNSVREQYVKLQLQLNSQSGANSKDRQLTASLEQLRSEIKSEVSHGLKDLEMSRMEVLDELQELHEQKAELTRQLHLLHSNLQGARLDADIDRDEEYLRDLSLTQDKSWRKEELHQQLTQEQDQLKLQIQQRMSRQAKILDGVKQKSQTTLHNLKKKLQNLEDLVSSNSRSRTELTQELDVNHVFQSTRISSNMAGDAISDRFESYPSTNHRTEMPEHDTYSSRHGQSDTALHKLQTDQSESDYANGDAYSYQMNQSEFGKPLRGILKRSHSTTDDQPASRPRKTVSSALDDVSISYRYRDQSPPSRQTASNIPAYSHQRPISPSHSYSQQRHSRRMTSPHRPERDTHDVARDSRMQDFMESIKRLKEEKLAEIERVSMQTS